MSIALSSGTETRKVSNYVLSNDTDHEGFEPGLAARVRQAHSNIIDEWTRWRYVPRIPLRKLAWEIAHKLGAYESKLHVIEAELKRQTEFWIGPPRKGGTHDEAVAVVFRAFSNYAVTLSGKAAVPLLRMLCRRWQYRRYDPRTKKHADEANLNLKDWSAANGFTTRQTTHAVRAFEAAGYVEKIKPDTMAAQRKRGYFFRLHPIPQARNVTCATAHEAQNVTTRLHTLLLTEKKNPYPPPANCDGAARDETTEPTTAKTKPALRRLSGVRKQGWMHVEIEHLRDPARLFEVWERYKDHGVRFTWQDCVAMAQHALRCGRKNACGMFASNVRKGRWHMITATDDDAANNATKPDQAADGHRQRRVDRAAEKKQERVQHRTQKAGDQREEVAVLKRDVAAVQAGEEVRHVDDDARRKAMKLIGMSDAQINAALCPSGGRVNEGQEANDER